MNDAFSREEMLLGASAVRVLKASHVMVFGVGGVGSYAAEGLARAGIGKITLIDNDYVSESNLNRQLCALHSTLGRAKAEVMAERIRDINPDCKVIARAELYCADTSESFFTERCDYIIDAIDLVSCKLHLIEAAKSRSIPIVSAMGTGNKYHPELFRITDISKTRNCPLARVVRKELRARGIEHHTVIFSEELPQKAVSDEIPPEGRRSIPGSLSWVPSCAGLMLSGYVVMQLIAEQTNIQTPFEVIEK